jgi:hypothetical protein
MVVFNFHKTFLFIIIDLLLWISLWNISDYVFHILNLNQHTKFIVNIIIASICIFLLSQIPR